MIYGDDLINVESGLFFDISLLTYHIGKFLDLINPHRNLKYHIYLFDTIQDLYLATLELQICKNLLYSYLMPENNPYIKYIEDNHKWFIDDLGRIDKRIKEFQKDIRMVSIKMEGDYFDDSYIKRGYGDVYPHLNYILELFNGLIYYPLINAYKRYKLLEKEIKPDEQNEFSLKETQEKLFFYHLFLEAYHGSLTLGNITREEIVKRVGGKVGFTQPNYLPESVPMRDQMEDKITEDDLETMFSDSFTDEEKND